MYMLFMHVSREPVPCALWRVGTGDPYIYTPTDGKLSVSRTSHVNSYSVQVHVQLCRLAWFQFQWSWSGTGYHVTRPENTITVP